MRPRLLATLAAAAALGGCGGGLYFNFGEFFGDGFAPDVSLASAQTSAAPGGRVHLVAAASDDSGIDDVAFYRRRQRALRMGRGRARRRLGHAAVLRRRHRRGRQQHAQRPGGDLRRALTTARPLGRDSATRRL